MARCELYGVYHGGIVGNHIPGSAVISGPNSIENAFVARAWLQAAGANEQRLFGLTASERRLRPGPGFFAAGP